MLVRRMGMNSDEFQFAMLDRASETLPPVIAGTPDDDSFACSHWPASPSPVPYTPWQGSNGSRRTLGRIQRSLQLTQTRAAAAAEGRQVIRCRSLADLLRATGDRKSVV